MNVTVLYFAALRELVGRAEESVCLPTHVTTIDAFSKWMEAHRKELRGRLVSVRIARNEEFARLSDAIAEGDTLAFIPPVAGG